MGLFDRIRRLLAGAKSAVDVLPPPEQGRGADELARWLNIPLDQLQRLPVAYHQYTIPKRTGGERTITAPHDALKHVQRAVLHRVLAGVRAHPAAMGFERGQSIATHALLHARRTVVVTMDIRDFFASTSDVRVHGLFRRIGWNDEAARTLTRWCTHEGGLPQGAPTSPRLSNLVNYRLDARLDGAANTIRQCINPKTLEKAPGQAYHGWYSRYADDLAFSFDIDSHAVINGTIHLVQEIVEDEGYHLHTRKKLRIMRRHDRQQVTGLVVNQRVQLPRATRRWLRAVEHRLANGQPATLDESQVKGWYAVRQMIDVQTGRS